MTTKELSAHELHGLTRERLHSAATWRYWTDPVFHARCEFVLRVLGGEESMPGRLSHQVLYALALDDVVRDGMS